MALLITGLAVAFFIWQNAKSQQAMQQMLKSSREANNKLQQQLIDAKPNSASGATATGSIVGSSSETSTAASPVCRIDTTHNWTWTSPEPPKATLAIDGKLVGRVVLSSQAHDRIPFPCQPGEHRFSFQIQFSQASHTCSGSFLVDRALNYTPVIGINNGVTTCSLEPVAQKK